MDMGGQVVNWSKAGMQVYSIEYEFKCKQTVSIPFSMWDESNRLDIVPRKEGGGG